MGLSQSSPSDQIENSNTLTTLPEVSSLEIFDSSHKRTNCECGTNIGGTENCDNRLADSSPSSIQRALEVTLSSPPAVGVDSPNSRSQFDKSSLSATKLEANVIQSTKLSMSKCGSRPSVPPTSVVAVQTDDSNRRPATIPTSALQRGSQDSEKATVIEFAVRNFWKVAKQQNDVESPQIGQCRGFYYRLLIHPRGTTGTESESSHLSVFLEAIKQDWFPDDWVFPNVRFELTVVNFLDPRQSVTSWAHWSFSNDAMSRGWQKMLIHSRLTRQQGFIDDEGTVLIRGKAEPPFSGLWSRSLPPHCRALALWELMPSAVLLPPLSPTPGTRTHPDGFSDGDESGCPRNSDAAGFDRFTPLGSVPLFPSPSPSSGNFKQPALRRGGSSLGAGPNPPGIGPFHRVLTSMCGAVVPALGTALHTDFLSCFIHILYHLPELRRELLLWSTPLSPPRGPNQPNRAASTNSGLIEAIQHTFAHMELWPLVCTLLQWNPSLSTELPQSVMGRPVADQQLTETAFAWMRHAVSTFGGASSLCEARAIAMTAASRDDPTSFKRQRRDSRDGGFRAFVAQCVRRQPSCRRILKALDMDDVQLVGNVSEPMPKLHYDIMCTIHRECQLAFVKHVMVTSQPSTLKQPQDSKSSTSQPYLWDAKISPSEDPCDAQELVRVLRSLFSMVTGDGDPVSGNDFTASFIKAKHVHSMQKAIEVACMANPSQMSCVTGANSGKSSKVGKRATTGPSIKRLPEVMFVYLTQQKNTKKGELFDVPVRLEVSSILHTEDVSATSKPSDTSQQARKRPRSDQAQSEATSTFSPVSESGGTGTTDPQASLLPKVNVPRCEKWYSLFALIIREGDVGGYSVNTNNTAGSVGNGSTGYYLLLRPEEDGPWYRLSSNRIEKLVARVEFSEWKCHRDFFCTAAVYIAEDYIDASIGDPDLELDLKALNPPLFYRTLGEMGVAEAALDIAAYNFHSAFPVAVPPAMTPSRFGPNRRDLTNVGLPLACLPRQPHCRPTSSGKWLRNWWKEERVYSKLAGCRSNSCVLHASFQRALEEFLLFEQIDSLKDTLAYLLLERTSFNSPCEENKQGLNALSPEGITNLQLQCRIKLRTLLEQPFSEVAKQAMLLKKTAEQWSVRERETGGEYQIPLDRLSDGWRTGLRTGSFSKSRLSKSPLKRSRSVPSSTDQLDSKHFAELSALRACVSRDVHAVWEATLAACRSGATIIRQDAFLSSFRQLPRCCCLCQSMTTGIACRGETCCPTCCYNCRPKRKRSKLVTTLDTNQTLPSVSAMKAYIGESWPTCGLEKHELAAEYISRKWPDTTPQQRLNILAAANLKTPSEDDASGHEDDEGPFVATIVCDAVTTVAECRSAAEIFFLRQSMDDSSSLSSECASGNHQSDHDVKYALRDSSPSSTLCLIPPSADTLFQALPPGLNHPFNWFEADQEAAHEIDPSAFIHPRVAAATAARAAAIAAAQSAQSGLSLQPLDGSPHIFDLPPAADVTLLLGGNSAGRGSVKSQNALLSGSANPGGTYLQVVVLAEVDLFGREGFGCEQIVPLVAGATWPPPRLFSMESNASMRSVYSVFRQLLHIQKLGTPMNQDQVPPLAKDWKPVCDADSLMLFALVADLEQTRRGRDGEAPKRGRYRYVYAHPDDLLSLYADAKRKSANPLVPDVVLLLMCCPLQSQIPLGSSIRNRNRGAKQPGQDRHKHVGDESHPMVDDSSSPRFPLTDDSSYPLLIFKWFNHETVNLICISARVCDSRKKLEDYVTEWMLPILRKSGALASSEDDVPNSMANLMALEECHIRTCQNIRRHNVAIRKINKKTGDVIIIQKRRIRNSDGSPDDASSNGSKGLLPISQILSPSILSQLDSLETPRSEVVAAHQQQLLRLLLRCYATGNELLPSNEGLRSAAENQTSSQAAMTSPINVGLVDVADAQRLSEIAAALCAEASMTSKAVGLFDDRKRASFDEGVLFRGDEGTEEDSAFSLGDWPTGPAATARNAKKNKKPKKKKAARHVMQIPANTKSRVRSLYMQAIRKNEELQDVVAEVEEDTTQVVHEETSVTGPADAIPSPEKSPVVVACEPVASTSVHGILPELAVQLSDEPTAPEIDEPCTGVDSVTLCDDMILVELEPAPAEVPTPSIPPPTVFRGALWNFEGSGVSSEMQSLIVCDAEGPGLVSPQISNNWGKTLLTYSIGKCLASPMTELDFLLHVRSLQQNSAGTPNLTSILPEIHPTAAATTARELDSFVKLCLPDPRCRVDFLKSFHSDMENAINDSYTFDGTSKIKVLYSELDVLSVLLSHRQLAAIELFSSVMLMSPQAIGTKRVLQRVCSRLLIAMDETINAQKLNSIASVCAILLFIRQRHIYRLLDSQAGRRFLESMVKRLADWMRRLSEHVEDDQPTKVVIDCAVSIVALALREFLQGSGNTGFAALTLWSSWATPQTVDLVFSRVLPVGVPCPSISSVAASVSTNSIRQLVGLSKLAFAESLNRISGGLKFEDGFKSSRRGSGGSLSEHAISDDESSCKSTEEGTQSLESVSSTWNQRKLRYKDDRRGRLRVYKDEPRILLEGKSWFAVYKPAFWHCSGPVASGIERLVDPHMLRCGDIEEATRGVRTSDLINSGRTESFHLWMMKKFPRLETVKNWQELECGLCHRIDLETSGALLIASSRKSRDVIWNQFRRRNVHKEYLMLCHGRMDRSEGTVKTRLLTRDLDSKGGRKIRSHFTEVVREGGEDAITEYAVVRIYVRKPWAEIVKHLLANPPTVGEFFTPRGGGLSSSNAEDCGGRRPSFDDTSLESQRKVSASFSKEGCRMERRGSGARRRVWVEPSVSGQVTEDEYFSLCRCRILTGRTHQIRVHMKHVGHPLVGDTKYLEPKKCLEDRQWCPRMFLHAALVEFGDPDSPSGPNREVVCPLAHELVQALDSALTCVEVVENTDCYGLGHVDSSPERQDKLKPSSLPTSEKQDKPDAKSKSEEPKQPKSPVIAAAEAREVAQRALSPLSTPIFSTSSFVSWSTEEPNVGETLAEKTRCQSPSESLTQPTVLKSPNLDLLTKRRYRTLSPNLTRQKIHTSPPVNIHPSLQIALRSLKAPLHQVEPTKEQITLPPPPRIPLPRIETPDHAGILHYNGCRIDESEHCPQYVPLARGYGDKGACQALPKIQQLLMLAANKRVYSDDEPRGKENNGFEFIPFGRSDKQRKPVPSPPISFGDSSKESLSWKTGGNCTRCLFGPRLTTHLAIPKRVVMRDLPLGSSERGSCGHPPQIFFPNIAMLARDMDIVGEYRQRRDAESEARMVNELRKCVFRLSSLLHSHLGKVEKRPVDVPMNPVDPGVFCCIVFLGDGRWRFTFVGTLLSHLSSGAEFVLRRRKTDPNSSFVISSDDTCQSNSRGMPRWRLLLMCSVFPGDFEVVMDNAADQLHVSFVCSANDSGDGESADSVMSRLFGLLCGTGDLSSFLPLFDQRRPLIVHGLTRDERRIQNLPGCGLINTANAKLLRSLLNNREFLARPESATRHLPKNFAANVTESCLLSAFAGEGGDYVAWIRDRLFSPSSSGDLTHCVTQDVERISVSCAMETAPGDVIVVPPPPLSLPPAPFEIAASLLNDPTPPLTSAGHWFVEDVLGLVANPCNVA